MYEKRLFNNQALYFRFAPPLTDLDDFSDDDLPYLPFKDAQKHQRSVYYYWWLFLKEHEGYIACCDRRGNGDYKMLYRDFGDVRSDDFMEWWKTRGRYLFCEPPPDPVQICKRTEDVFNEEGRVILSVPIAGDAKRIIDDVKFVLEQTRKQYIKKFGRNAYRELEDSKQPKYPVFTKPVLTSLHQHYEVWRYRKTRPEMKNHEIADAVGIMVDEKSDKGGDPKQQKSIYVSRYFRQAQCLIEHVGKGLFPVTKPHQVMLKGILYK